MTKTKFKIGQEVFVKSGWNEHKATICGIVHLPDRRIYRFRNCDNTQNYYRDECDLRDDKVAVGDGVWVSLGNRKCFGEVEYVYNSGAADVEVSVHVQPHEMKKP